LFLNGKFLRRHIGYHSFANTCVFSFIGIRLSIIPLIFLHVFPVVLCVSLYSRSSFSSSQLSRYLKAVVCFSCWPSTVICNCSIRSEFRIVIVFIEFCSFRQHYIDRGYYEVSWLENWKLRPKKKICGFPVSSYKNLGRVGRF
jgi:hypothetical protein